MRTFVIVLFAVIGCVVFSSNAAKLPESAEEHSNVNEITTDDIPQAYDEDLPQIPNQGFNKPQRRTLFLLLPLLFPDQFYF
ncbi:uncharacterized protein [Musca autumnalis]|uniref:uncharacterized protein n=1 Tax=Musca autumnalis TaxID=221902 RepID=UPI003CFA7235